MKTMPILFFVTLLLCSTAFAAEPVKPATGDKCPVCGMFVVKYQEFLAEIIFKDGSYAVFDGSKDMFSYYFNLSRYNASKKKEDIASIYVTDYYSLNLVDGTKAFYVVGSNVLGPMGRELISFEKQGDANEFAKDHAGKTRLHFNEITPDLVKGLE